MKSMHDKEVFQPAKVCELDAGHDMRCMKACSLEANTSQSTETGVHVEIPASVLPSDLEVSVIPPCISENREQGYIFEAIAELERGVEPHMKHDYHKLDNGKWELRLYR